MRNVLSDHPWTAWAATVVGHGLFFAAIGPAIGTVASPGVVVLPIAVVFSYVTSVPAAFVTGCLTGAAAMRLSDHRRLGFISAAIGAACGALTPASLGGWDYPGVIVMYALAGAFAGLCCTQLSHFLRRRGIARHD